MKSSAYPPFIDNPPIWTIPSSFLQENLDPPPTMIFQKSHPLVNKGGGSQYALECNFNKILVNK